MPLSDLIINDDNKIVRNLRVNPMDASNLIIRWSTPLDATNVLGYRIYRSFDYTQVFKPVGVTSGVLGTFYIDRDLKDRDIYFYRIRTVYV